MGVKGIFTTKYVKNAAFVKNVLFAIKNSIFDDKNAFSMVFCRSK